MNGIHQFPEILQCSQFGIDPPVILNGIRTAQASFPVDPADGMNRHEPDDIRPERPDSGQIGNHGEECPLFRKISYEHGIDHLTAKFNAGITCHITQPFLSLIRTVTLSAPVLFCRSVLTGRCSASVQIFTDGFHFIFSHRKRQGIRTVPEQFGFAVSVDGSRNAL